MEYEVAETDDFKLWRENLRDVQAKHRIQARIDRAITGNFGDWKTEEGEVRAMRIDYGPGYRLYYVIRGKKVVFLLYGGDKRSESADIKKATEIAKGV
jgi:putative addiction module killer protein